MFRYNAKIRIGGSVMNEVRKTSISAAEVMILRKLHGDDAVLDLTELDNDRSSHEKEREKLRRIYGVNRATENRTRINFTQMFGPDHVDLPARLPEIVRAEEAAANPPAMNVRTKLKNKFDVGSDEVALESIAG